ncbi:DUF4332 domain-containing protein [Bremerella cremea]|uniref:DUF4332 domain-containing protein n=1 Tax=Bremerella cremea TaxID=1031537 RepID=A0A368KK71_9BACT|nr:DUF4332 domain-containing protein [Bremerella cremea]RCS41157.1 DUF4332 domain-containing protein [Bremerella cremea]
MHLLFDILYAAHANGTHHKLALDALNYLHGDEASRRRNLFLKYYEPYLRGSKDPDKKFKDFRNHVLHVSQDYWGGAEKAARKWYDALVEALRHQKWSDAAYSAGVLSHYYSDPIMPFHTAQSEAENNIHRAVEWSISCSYDRLRATAVLRGQLGVHVPSGNDWLEQMVREGAEKSHQQYQVLIDHYNFKLGRRNPPRGLDVVCRDIVSALLGHAIGGIARILERAFDEAAVALPRVLLVAETVLATIEMPIQWVTNRIENQEQAERIRQMFREYQKTGKVERNLPEDVRAVRDELLAEQNQVPEETEQSEQYEGYNLPEVNLASLTRSRLGLSSAGKPAKKTQTDRVVERRSEPAKVKPGRVEKLDVGSEMQRPTLPREVPVEQVSSREVPQAEEVGPLHESSSPEFQPAKGVKIRPKLSPKKKMEPAVDEFQAEAASEKPAKSGKLKIARTEQVAESERQEELPQAKKKKSQRNEVPARDGRAIEEKKPVEGKPLKFYLEASDLVVDAPSIGNKTAKRLNGVGIRTVAQLIAADPDAVAPKIKVQQINADILAEWQAQAVLVCRIPMLRGHDAQLLTGCGYESPEAVARANAEMLLIEVEEYAETSAGQRILRGSSPPDLEEVTNWIAWAGQARRLQAA